MCNHNFIILIKIYDFKTEFQYNYSINSWIKKTLKTFKDGTYFGTIRFV